MTRSLPWVLLLSLGAAPTAQVHVVRHGDARLVGIREVDLWTEHLNPSTPTCPVPMARIEPAIITSFAHDAIKVTVSRLGPSSPYTLQLQTMSTRSGDLCTTMMRLALLAEVEGKPEANRALPSGVWGSLLQGHLVLAERLELVTTPATEHDERLVLVAREAAATLAGRIRAANQ